MNAIIIVLWFTLIVAAISGWVMNIINIVNSLGGELGILFLAQCFGVPFGPLGAILGWAVWGI